MSYTMAQYFWCGYFLVPPKIMCLLGDDFDYASVRGSYDQPWNKLLDYERLLCFCSARVLREGTRMSYVTVSPRRTGRVGNLHGFGSCI